MPRNTTPRSTAKSTQRTAPKTGAGDALRMLADDHKRVKKMFEQFEKLKDKEMDDEQKQLLVETACAELTIHAQLEEEMLYPAARDAIDDMDLLDEAEVEHASAKHMISELSTMQPGDHLYDAKFTVLGEYVKHHIEEEEKELFPKLKKADIDLVELAEAMKERKMALREELGFTAEEEDQKELESKLKSRKSMH
jgi:hemerythrin superfamily protein